MGVGEDRSASLLSTDHLLGHWAWRIGIGKNRDAIGARVKVVSDDLTQWDEVHAGGSYLSSSDLRLHYGLGKRNKIDLIEVHWPDGKVETARNTPVNNFLFIEEGKGIIRIVPPNISR